MPFKSKAQMRAAFSGALGSKMRERAETWAHETPDIKGLPDHVKGGKPTHRSGHDTMSSEMRAAHRKHSDSIRGKTYKH